MLLTLQKYCKAMLDTKLCSGFLGLNKPSIVSQTDDKAVSASSLERGTGTTAVVALDDTIHGLSFHSKIGINMGKTIISTNVQRIKGRLDTTRLNIEYVVHLIRVSALGPSIGLEDVAEPAVPLAIDTELEDFSVYSDIAPNAYVVSDSDSDFDSDSDAGTEWEYSSCHSEAGDMDDDPESETIATPDTPERVLLLVMFIALKVVENSLQDELQILEDALGDLDSNLSSVEMYERRSVDTLQCIKDKDTGRTATSSICLPGMNKFLMVLLMLGFALAITFWMSDIYLVFMAKHYPGPFLRVVPSPAAAQWCKGHIPQLSSAICRAGILQARGHIGHRLYSQLMMGLGLA